MNPMPIKQVRRFLWSQVPVKHLEGGQCTVRCTVQTSTVLLVKFTLTETSKKVLIYDSLLFKLSSFSFQRNGRESRRQDIAVWICGGELTINGLSAEYNHWVAGLYGPEEVLHNAHPQDHWCFHRWWPPLYYEWENQVMRVIFMMWLTQY